MAADSLFGTQYSRDVMWKRSILVGVSILHNILQQEENYRRITKKAHLPFVVPLRDLDKS